MKKALAIRHVKIEHAGILGNVLYDKGFQIDYLDTYLGQLLNEPIENYSFVIVLGGYMGAYEESKYPFLNYEFKIIEYALKENIPLIGICLGSQMLARVLGSKVYKGHKKEIGFYEVIKVQEHEYFREFPSSLDVFQWHNDTFDLPDKTVRIFSSVNYENQGFVFNKAVGLQFHIEVSKDMINNWLVEYQDEVDANNINVADILLKAEEKTTKSYHLSLSLVNNLI